MKIHPLACAVLVCLLTACTPTSGLAVAPTSAPPAGGAVPDYDRDQFGNGWADLDSDCQDTRQEVLLRDLVDVALTGDGCDIASGTLHDSYTGTTIAFRRGQGTSDDVQIDHVIPLSYAWQAGAWQWTDTQRETFNNDDHNLRAVDGPANNRKGDRGPSRWLPPNPAAHCAYAATWRDMTSAYAFVIDPADAARVEEILRGC